MKLLNVLIVAAALCAVASAQFQFCGTGTPYNSTLAPHSTSWLFMWTTPGTKFDLNCVSVVPPSDSKIYVDVSIAYSPNYESGPFAILSPLSTQYDLNTDIHVQYPTSGYFYLVATNLLDTSVTVQFQADGTISSSGPLAKASRHGVANQGRIAVPRDGVAQPPQFNLCQKNYTASVAGRTAQNLMYWTNAAMSLTITCLEVTAGQQNPSNLNLWIACGPQPTTGPVVKLQKIVAQAQPESAIAVQCPIKGYFRLTVFNNDGTPANLQFGASGNVFLPDGSQHGETATI